MRKIFYLVSAIEHFGSVSCLCELVSYDCLCHLLCLVLGLRLKWEF